MFNISEKISSGTVFSSWFSAYLETIKRGLAWLLGAGVVFVIQTVYRRKKYNKLMNLIHQYWHAVLLAQKPRQLCLTNYQGVRIHKTNIKALGILMWIRV